MRRCTFFIVLRGVVAWPSNVQSPLSWLRAHAMTSLLLTLGLVVSPPSAWAQEPVTAADLVGTTMTASVTSDRVMRREGRQFPQRYQVDWTIKFVSEDTIRPTFVATSYNPRSVRKTPLEGGGLVPLGRPAEISSRGGGHRIWIFDPGVLTLLRTYEGGAYKTTFAVTRSEAGFSCTASVSWPRETGVPTIVLRSPYDGGRVEIVSAK